MPIRRLDLMHRLLQLITLLLGLSLAAFLLLYLAPGDPAQKKLTAQGLAVSADVLEQTRREMGLDRPFPVQYLDWLLHCLRGDFGLSYKDGLPVLEKLLKGFRHTALLTASALAFSLGVAVPLGIVCAVRPTSLLDSVVRMLCHTLNSIPHFLLSVVFMYLFCIRVKWFDVVSRPGLRGLVLPCLVLAIPLSSRLVLQLRNEVRRELDKPYVTGALARGLSPREVLWQDVLHNSLLPLLTMIGLSAGTLMGGSVVAESIFGWPGVGSIAVSAISAHDYPTVQGFVVLSAGFYVLFNLVTDLAYRAVDPRVRTEGGSC